MGQCVGGRAPLQWRSRLSNDAGAEHESDCGPFSTDYGLMSAGVIAFVIVMGVWFYRFFARKIAESEQAARKS